MPDDGNPSGEVKLSCRNIWKVYGDKPKKFFTRGDGNIGDPEATISHAQSIRDSKHIVANANVSFDVHLGETFAIMGLSGSGKSSILRCLSRIVEPTAGEILFNGKNLLDIGKNELVDFRRRKIGIVFQKFGLMPHLNVIDNVSFPLELLGHGRKERYAKMQQVIDIVGLSGREYSFPRELTKEQLQKASIARSLAVEPEFWFLDEPFSILDPLIRRQMQDEFLRLQKDLNKSVVFITNDFLEALRIADRMVLMRDGQVVQTGRPVDILLNPADEYVQQLTNDIAWDLALTAGDIAIPNGKHKSGMKRIAFDTPLQDLLTQLSQKKVSFTVKNHNGKDIGTIDTQAIISALARNTKQPNLDEA